MKVCKKRCLIINFLEFIRERSIKFPLRLLQHLVRKNFSEAFKAQENKKDRSKSQFYRIQILKHRNERKFKIMISLTDAHSKIRVPIDYFKRMEYNISILKYDAGYVCKSLLKKLCPDQSWSDETSKDKTEKVLNAISG